MALVGTDPTQMQIPDPAAPPGVSNAALQALPPQHNPILGELSKLSPGAQQALMNAHHSVVAAKTAAMAPPQANANPQTNTPIQAARSAPPSLQAPPMPQGVESSSSLMTMPSKVPSLGGAPQAPSLVAPRGTVQGEQAERDRLLSTGNGVSQIHNLLLRGLAGVGTHLLGGVAGAISPADGGQRIMGNVPGTEAHHEKLVNTENQRIGELQGEQQKTAQTAGEQAKAGLENAQTPEVAPNAEAERNLKGAQTDVAEGKVDDPTNFNPERETYRYLTGKLGMSPQEAYQELNQEKGAPGREQAKDLKEQALAQQQQLAGESRKDREQFHADSEKDRALTREQMAKNQETKAAKPTADEQKKADLVDNLNENLGVVEEIAKRRPDLFGPVAGRMTQLKNTIGTSDPDIAALEAAQHQLGMVQQGVHGMRSAQGMQGAVDALMNGFHDSPEAMQRSIDTARNSAKTFSVDVGQKGKEGIGGVGAGEMVRARDPQGKLHEAPAGTALPQGWKKE